MRLTYSTAAERAQSAREVRRQGRRGIELLALVAASLLSVAGLWLTFAARTASFDLVQKDLAAGKVLNLNAVDRAEQLLPILDHVSADPGERRFIADRIAAWLTTPDGQGDVRRRLETLAPLGGISVGDSDLGRNRRVPAIRARLAAKRERLEATPGSSPADVRVSLLTPAQVAALRPSLVVRSAGDVRQSFFLALALFFVGFYGAHVAGRRYWPSADPWLLPIIHVLCGIGLAAMVSLRDPLREALLFGRFAQGTLAGGALLAVLGAVDYQKTVLRRLSFVPLIGAILLSTLLIAFGSGPGASDAKVNLLGFQPVEAIRLLVVLFLAGYFASRWEVLRALKETKLDVASKLGVEVPRLDYVLPVLIGMALLLVFFFLQRDLGPALVLACVFLGMYGVARRRVTMVMVGLGLLVSGFVIGYWLGFPHAVVQRVQIWMSPWDNAVRGGDQVAHALWAMASGAATGTGLGLGDAHLVPAAHTDLVLAAVGEELGFVGVFAVLVLSGLLAWRAVRIALRAPGDYTFFLALGLTLNLVLQLALIAGGLLGLVPLTGVVTPFLSYGRSSMLANFATFGVLLAISARSAGQDQREEFRIPSYCLAGVVGVMLAAILFRAGTVQLLRADRTLVSPALTVQADGARRFEYNPRLLMAAQQIARGTIFDRNGIPLATSRPEDLRDHAAALAQVGASSDVSCVETDGRCYPLGGLVYHVLGDVRTQQNWAATNTSFVERDSDARLRGYNDHARVVEVVDPRTGRRDRVLRRDLSEIVPLFRYRYNPDHPAVKKLLSRPRDVKLSIDARFQVKLAALVKAGVDQAGQKEGAAAVLSQDGDLLAAVSYPWPVLTSGAAATAATPVTASATTNDTDNTLLDRARYGLYPPGSSFKIVTASAALRADPTLAQQAFTCERLPDGRVGKQIPGWGRPIRDDKADTAPHGTLTLERAIIVSCNAYFAQLGLKLGAPALMETAGLYEISLGQPESAKQVRDTLPFAAYGQGQVLASPFKMARVAATIGGGGAMPQGRWVIDETNDRTDAPRSILTPAAAQSLASAMRHVVLEGTGRSLKGIEPPIAGKTGTAEVKDAGSHSWFVGFAPYGAATKRIAFAVIVEHGGYGGTAAAPIAGKIVTTAKELGFIGQ